MGRLVEEALDSASALLSGHRATLDRLAERLSEHETVNGSEVTAMLAEVAAAQDAGTGHADRGNRPNPWHDIGLLGVAQVEKAGSGNGHEPIHASLAT